MKILMINFIKMVNDTGGVAKVCCAFSNEMIARGHQVSIIHSDEKEGDFFYHIDEQVALYNATQNLDGRKIKFPVSLKLLREFYRLFNKKKAQTVNRDFVERYLIKNIKSYIEKVSPDIIVSYHTEASIYLLYNLKIDIPVITMSHREQKDYYDEKEKIALEHSAVYQVLVPSFERHINNMLPDVNTITIGNAIPQYKFYANLDAEKEQYKVVFVGRLTRNHKRPHLLIHAFASISSKHPNWICELWGQKFRENYYAELQQVIKDKNLQNRVFLKGTTNDVSDVLKGADLFAFPSEYEAFPLALSEAMSAGLPVVAYKDCPGVNELVEDSINGFLCAEGIESFALGLDRLMSDKELRVKMGKEAKESMKKFAPKVIWDTWEALLELNVRDKKQ